LCDFEIRVLGNVHRHTVQCVLVINMFTEKIFVFLWLWLLLLSFGTAINLVVWFLSLAFSSWRHSFVTKFLECESDQTHRFVHHFLRPDGVLLLHVSFFRTSKRIWSLFSQLPQLLSAFH
uniref:Innexin n=1 Tax=Anisakis simplex TaxID=6269 RepID=A0A0M3KCS8_ANISI